MKNIAFVNCIGLNRYALEPLPNGRNAFSSAIETARKLPDVEQIVVLCTEFRKEFEGLSAAVQETWTLRTLVEIFIKEGEGHDSLFYLYGDVPFLDLSLSGRMYGNHRKYFAQYTFADGYPGGLAPEILSVQALPMLAGLVSDEPIPESRGELFSIVSKDINAFDLETELAPEDQRLLRVRLSCDSKRNALLVRRVMESGVHTLPEITRILGERPELLRTLPAFAPIQITGGCPQACSYCPYPLFGGDVMTRRDEMPLSSFQRIMEEVKSFCDDCVIGLSLWGEPSFHSSIERMIESVVSIPGLSLLVETSGIGWKPGSIERILSRGGSGLTWIVSLDAKDPALYRNLRGDGMGEALAFAGELLRLAPEKTHVQAVRVKENEEDIETFYREWKGVTQNVIIQKYDSCAGLLPDRSVADLSPLKRFPCWHLKRDLPILIDGTILNCREETPTGRSTAPSPGNILESGLEELWEKGADLYRAHCLASYPELCMGCDEYYTYNF